MASLRHDELSIYSILHYGESRLTVLVEMCHGTTLCIFPNHYYKNKKCSPL